jgi:hypothetical protein
MRWSDIPFAPPSRTLRQFAGLWVAFFGGLSAWQGFARGHTAAAAVLAAVAVLVGPLGLIRPQAVRWIYVGWMVAVFPVGWVLSRLVLAVMFFGVVTPVALVFRLLGRDALHRRARPAATSYWEPKPAAPTAASYLQQF